MTFRSRLRGPATPTRGTRCRPSVEPLEGRLCPSYTTIDLGTLGGASNHASAVNASGQVVGAADPPAGTGYEHAVLWQSGTITDLGTLGGVASWAVDINDAGQVVGGYRTADPTPVGHAYLWQNGFKTDLGTLGGAASGVDAINNRGQIVGNAQTVGGAYRPFVWQAGVMYDLIK
jgi:probable HAF family extracellular repeat protein